MPVVANQHIQNRRELEVLLFNKNGLILINFGTEHYIYRVRRYFWPWFFVNLCYDK